VNLAAGIKEIVQDKGLSEELIIEALKDVLENAYKEYFGAESISVDFDIEKGNLKVFIPKQVVKRVRDPRNQVNTKQAATILGVKEVDESTKEVLVPYFPMKDFSPTEIMKISNAIVDKLRNVEKNSLRHEFYKKKGELASGSIIKVNTEGDIFVDLGKTIGIIPFTEQSPLEHYENGDNIRAVVIGVEGSSPHQKKKAKKVQVTLSRKSPSLIKELLFLEIPEIADESIEIKGIARLAGYKTKVIVQSINPNVDAVASCIGPHGVRIISIIKEIGGEKIDIIHYSENLKELVKNALIPAKVDRVVMSKTEEGTDIIYAVVPHDQLPYAFGRQKQNVILVSKLLNHKIQIQTSEEMFEKQIEEEEVGNLKDIFGTTLDVLNLPQLLISKLHNYDIASVEHLVEIHVNQRYKEFDLIEEEIVLLQQSIKENIEISEDDSFNQHQKEDDGKTPLEELPDLATWVPFLKENGIYSIEQLVTTYNQGFYNIKKLSLEDKEKIIAIIEENIEIED
jgi:N utilization substance protein A